MIKVNSNDQNRSNMTGALNNSYQAKIVSVDHPKGLFLAKIRLLGLWDNIAEQDLPWGEFLLPLGCRQNEGQHIPVNVGDLVWIDFPRMGDTRYPRIIGSCYFAPDYNSELPTNGSYGKGATGEPPAPELSLKDNVYERYGLQEYKTTSGTWGVVHIETGTRLEISKGGIVIHSEGDNFRSSTGNTTEKVAGDLNTEVKGNVTSKTGGNVTSKTGGSVKMTISGNMDVSAAAISFNAASTLSLNAGSMLTLGAAAISMAGGPTGMSVGPGGMSVKSPGAFTVKAAAADWTLG